MLKTRTTNIVFISSRYLCTKNNKIETMPKTKDALIRLKKLDELLSCTYREYTLGELTEAVNDTLCRLDKEPVTQRCIQKDINFIEYEWSPSREIKRYMKFGRHIIKYEDCEDSIFTRELTSDERNIIKELLNMVGQFEGLPNFDYLNRRCLSFKFEDIDAEYTPVVSFAKNPLENSNIFGELYTSISQKQVIELHYYKFDNPTEEKKVNVYPYLLKEYNRRWFLFCACAPNKDGKILNFALDRIKSFNTLPSEHYEDYKGDWGEYFEDIVGVTNFDNEVTQKILFWVSDDNNSKDYVQTKPLHESQTFLKDDTPERKQYPQLHGGGFFTIDCKYNYELVRELCSYGRDLIVLSPESIRAKVWKRVCEMYEAYNQ